jgi:flagellar basal body-associated protein FliL
VKSKRNRIVIDLNRPAGAEAPRSGRRRSARLGRVLAIIGIVLVLFVIALAAGGYFWWQHYKAQPAYTLASLVDAAQRNDNQEMDRILDIDKISEGFVTDVRARLTDSSILNSVLPSQVDQIAANLTPQLKETLREILPGEIQRLTEPAKGKPFFLIALGVPYFADVKQDGATATADLKLKDEQVQLSMQQQGGDSWRITAIKDDRLTGIIADAARKSFSQRGSQLQDELRRQLKDWKLPSASPSP